MPSVLLLLVSSCGVHADAQTAPRTTGGSVQFAATESEERSGDWSRDGKWIAFESDRTGNTDIWIQPVAAGAAIQITHDEAADFVPRWSPQGDRLLFVSERTGASTIWMVDPFNKAASPTQVTTKEDDLAGKIASWSPDGTEIVFSSNSTGNWDLWAIAAAGGQARQITDRPANDWDPDWSADGEWIAVNAGPTAAAADLWIVLAAGG